MGGALPNASVSKVEMDNSSFIPQGNQVTKNTVKLADGGYMQTLRMQGAAHESADVRDINTWHHQLNNWLRNIASPNIAIWTHIVRREYNEYPGGEFENSFCKKMNEDYRAKMQGQRMLINELYVTVVYRPEPVKVLNLLSRLTPKSAEERREQQVEDLAFMDDVMNSCLSSLDRYDPELLGCYEHNGYWFSEVGEFLSFLINGEWRRFPLPRAELREILGTSRPFFGKGGTMALKAPTQTLYAGILAIQEYPTPTPPVLLNGLLGLPFEFVLTQSFTFLSKQVGVGRMKRQQSRMVNAGDVAESQVVAIDDALDGLVSGEYAYGVHHLALVVKSDDQNDLNDCISLAGAELSEVNMKWAREDEGLAGAFWSQLPGNFQYRTRPADITSRNFAAFASFHNYPIGHIRKNQWGDAVTVFRTSSGAPYYFNFHKGEEGNEAKRAAKFDPNHKDLANTIVIGNSGGGKTVLEMFLLAQIQKFTEGGKKKLSAFVFDKDQGASVGIRAMGGKYLTIKNGLPSGLNPMQLPLTPANLLFVDRWLKQLVRKEGQPLTSVDEKKLKNALNGVMNAQTPIENRRLSSLLEFFDPTEEDGLHIRLVPWTQYGDMGWLFDNESDTLSLADANIVGIDVTDFLKNPVSRTPTIMYLFHRLQQLLDGRRVPIFMDEFGQLLNDVAFEDFADDKLVTIRKLDGFLVMFTQFPKQILESPIASAIVTQTATKIFLPNPSADYADYVDGFKLTRTEFQIIRDLPEDSRRFLIKQGQNSVIAELNLNGFHDVLAVLSGNATTAALSERLVNELGPDPEVWLPEFHRIRKEEFV